MATSSCGTTPFRDHWFKINATTDLAGGLVETTAPQDMPAFAFNCDIATPMRQRGDAVFAVDLFLDVLVRSDGVTYGVYDQQELDDAVRRGWASEREAAGASTGLAELLELIEAGHLGAFLAEAQPFARVYAPPAMAMQPVPLQQVRLLQPSVRPSW
jgi:predicted RNA-binding protein associated with RNAse of E/G family